MTWHPVSAVPPVVAATLEGSYGHHRTPWFEGILEHIGTSLRPRLPPEFTPLILTATAPGAREAVVANCVVPGDTVLLSTQTGPFAPLVEGWGADARGLPRESDGAPVPVAEGGPTLALLEHTDNEGQLLPLEQTVAAIRARARNAVIVVDATVSFGADVASFDMLDIDGVIVVPEGALMGIPGLSIVAAGPRLLDLVRWCRPRLSVRPYYFDLLKSEKAWTKRTTPYSPDISACVALSKALELIEINGGLERHVVQHAARATALRQQLNAASVGVPEGVPTNAFTACVLPAGVSPAEVAGAVADQPVRVSVVAGDHRALRIEHTGYLPEGALAACCATIVASAYAGRAVESGPASVRIPDVTFPAAVPPNIPPDPELSIFEIPAKEFADQAVLHASRGGAGSFQAHIRRAALATFPAHHHYDAALLASRTIGFIGAGNIVRETVERCRRVGVRHIVVYSPSLAEQRQHGTLPAAGPAHRRLEYWLERGVEVAESAEDVFLQAHSIVLLPWFYDSAARAIFGKPPVYTNERIVNAAVLAAIERDGRADLIVNAAARGKLIDRDALLQVISAGWLRYYSDELPAADDPLLAFRNVRFTGHVGGSCRQPQALVGRNTHHILQQLIAHLLEGKALDADGDESGYRLNVLNATVPRSRTWRSGEAHPGGRVRRVRVLITDPFDIEALGFDRLRSRGWDIDVRDVSTEESTPTRLTHHLREFRPHILMVRSRTRVDAAIAAAACEVPELTAVVRPGVGIDNLYGGAQQLTEAGIRIINEPFGNSFAVAEMTMHFLLSAAENTLLAPGPTRVEPEVFAVMHEYSHPASVQVAGVITDVAKRFAGWVGASDPALVVSGSGTALMEAGVANLSDPGDQGLVISHGKFGDRFADIARAMGRSVDVLAVPEPEWGRAISPAEVESFFRAKLAASAIGGNRGISFLCLQQNETSSGVAYSTEQLGAIVGSARSHNPDMAIIVDAISGAFAHPIDFDSLDLDLLVVGSQKGLGVSSGLAFGQVSRRAWQAMLHRAGYPGSFEQWLAESEPRPWIRAFTVRQRVSYLSLLRLVHEQHRLVFTGPPSVFHLLSAKRALDLHDRDGGRDAVIARHARLGAFVREALASAGVRLMGDPAYRSDSVTPALLPSGVTASTVRKRLEGVYGFSIAGAQGDYWKSQMVRIGHFGFVYEPDVARCVRGLRTILKEPVQPGSNIAAIA